MKKELGRKKEINYINFLNFLLDEYDRVSKKVLDKYTDNRNIHINKNKRKRKDLIDLDSNHLKGKVNHKTINYNWLKWKYNSCRIDAFMTLYLFAIRPYLNTKDIINYIKDKDLLLHLEKSINILIRDPDNITRDEYWQYIDSKRIDGDNINISFYKKFAYISGLFTTFKNNIDFCLRYKLNEKCIFEIAIEMKPMNFLILS